MKLLSRTIITYTILSLIIFLVAIPFSYYLISKLIIEDVDEDLSIKKIFLQKKALYLKNNTELEVWQKMQDNIDLTLINNIKRDTFPESISFITLYDSLATEWEPYRELHSIIKISNQYYDLKLRVSLVESEDLINTIVRMLVFIFLGLIFGLILINRIISKTVWKTFYATLEKLKNYKVDETEKLNLSNSNISEFKDLNEVIVKMTYKIHADYVSMKQFTENASHEIQTPLSVIKNRVELILQDEKLNGANLIYVKSIYEAANKLSKVNQSLILLSKLENRQFNNYEKINIKTIIEEKLEMLDERVIEKNISLKLSIEDEIVSINYNLAQILISNLLTNAVKHNMSGGSIEIKLANKRLSIINTGDEPQKPISSFFERFQKNQQHTESLGLGLSIVKEICDHEGITISYLYENGLHIIKIGF